MTIGIGVWAFIIYIAVIVAWMMLLKRNITEAMGVGLIIAALFNGPAAIIGTIIEAVLSSAGESSFLATMLFLIMAVVMTKTGIIKNVSTGKIRIIFWGLKSARARSLRRGF